MNFKIENLEIDEEGNLKVDLPQETVDLLLRMFPDAETPKEAFQYYLTLATSRQAAVETAAKDLTDDPLPGDDHDS